MVLKQEVLFLQNILSYKLYYLEALIFLQYFIFAHIPLQIYWPNLEINNSGDNRNHDAQ